MRISNSDAEHLLHDGPADDPEIAGRNLVWWFDPTTCPNAVQLHRFP